MGLLERTARDIGDERFGFNLGYAMQPEDYGPVASYMASAPDLRTMIRRSIRAMRYHASGCEFSLDVSGRLARWGFRAVEPISFVTFLPPMPQVSLAKKSLFLVTLPLGAGGLCSY
jgi:hypothetical protein